MHVDINGSEKARLMTMVGLHAEAILHHFQGELNVIYETEERRLDTVKSRLRQLIEMPCHFMALGRQRKPTATLLTQALRFSFLSLSFPHYFPIWHVRQSLPPRLSIAR